MKEFKRYIAERMIGRRLHFKCDCTFKIDVVGTVVGYELRGKDILFLVNTGTKTIHIEENYPGMKVSEA